MRIVNIKREIISKKKNIYIAYCMHYNEKKYLLILEKKKIYITDTPLNCD